MRSLAVESAWRHCLGASPTPTRNDKNIIMRDACDGTVSTP